MTAFDFLFHSGNLPFLIALFSVAGLVLLELLASLGGGNPVDSLIPDFEMHAEVGVDLDVDASVDIDHDIDGGVGGVGFAGAVLGWLHVGRLPILILLALGLSGFAIGGLVIQWIWFNVTGHLMASSLATIPAFLFALFFQRTLGGILAKLLPRDESYAVDQSDFIGQVVLITQGTARFDMPAEGRLHDGHGRAHYVRVAPTTQDESFPEGSSVLLISRDKEDTLIFRGVLSGGDTLSHSA